MKKLYVNKKDVVFPIEHFLEESSPKKNKWWAGLPKPMPKAEFLDKLHQLKLQWLKFGNFNLGSAISELSQDRLSTRTCPGISGILNKSILVKMPADLHITVTKEDERFVFNSSSSESPVTVASHSVMQTKPDNDGIFNDKLILKLVFQDVSCKAESEVLFLHPHYHKPVPHTVINGVIEKDNTNSFDLNIIVLIDMEGQESKSILYEKGDVLCYLWSPDKLTVQETTDPLFKTKFSFCKRTQS